LIYGTRTTAVKADEHEIENK